MFPSGRRLVDNAVEEDFSSDSIHDDKADSVVEEVDSTKGKKRKRRLQLQIEDLDLIRKLRNNIDKI